MMTITHKTVYETADGRRFDTHEEARTHARTAAVSVALVEALENASNYWRDTCSLEIAEWIIENFEQIKSVMEGTQ